METINLNGKEYILKEEYENLEKQKEAKPLSPIDYLITEKCNVMGIVPLERKKYNLLEIQDVFEEVIIGFNMWKVVGQDLIIPQIKGFDKKFEVYLVDKSKFSKQMIDLASKTAKAFGYDGTPEIYLPFDKEKGTYINDSPCLVIFERSLVFLLAPRVEN
ncbi:MAG: hypothetical protein M0R17_05685 [Candidatus Omnitrophica bacterium]|jgi:hypothetical protein|nr:hypothetical protein [Candidatus Omnitrophota bacterium]